jgi:hypothetical protein
VNPQQPLVERNVRILKNRSDRNRKLLPAGPALIQAFAPVGTDSRFAVQLRRFAKEPAMGTERTIRPKLRFQIFSSGIFDTVLRSDQSHDLILSHCAF